MKIAPSLPTATHPAARSAAKPAAPSSGLFKSLLTDGDAGPAPSQASDDDSAKTLIDLAQAQQHRALGFSEAGLLGVGQGPFAAPPATVSEIDGASPPTGAAEAQAAAAAWVRPDQPSAPQPGAPAIAVAGPPSGALPGRTAPAGAGSAVATAPPGPSLLDTSAHALIVRTISDALRDTQAQDPATTSDRNPPSARFDPTRPPRPEAKTQVAVAVSEADGALQVVAASPGINPETAVRVRRIVSDLAERFGLRLSDLHLNGVRVAPFNTGSTGAAHGG